MKYDDKNGHLANLSSINTIKALRPLKLDAASASAYAFYPCMNTLSGYHNRVSSPSEGIVRTCA